MSSLPSGWTECALGDMGTWVGGGTPTKGQSRYWKNGTIPWVSPKDMKQQTLHGAEDRITEAAVRESATRLVPAGSVLMVTRSGILRHTLPIAINAVPVTINQDLKAITPRAGVDTSFLSWALRAHERQILHECSKTGTTVQSIEMPRLRAFTVPLPPVVEQRRIAAMLDERLSDLDAAVADLIRVQGKCRQLRASVMKAAADGTLMHRDASTESKEGPEPWCPRVPGHWCFSTVGELATLVEYGTSAKTAATGSGVPVLRMGNIVDGELNWQSLKYLPTTHHELPRLMLQPGDVLFNRTNSPELVGKGAVYRAPHLPASFASYLLRIRFGPEMLPDFFVAYLNSVYGRSWVASVASQQVGQANVNGTKLRALPVPVPPMHEQRAIVDAVENANVLRTRLSATVEARLRAASHLRESIMNAAFHGALRA